MSVSLVDMQDLVLARPLLLCFLHTIKQTHLSYHGYINNTMFLSQDIKTFHQKRQYLVCKKCEI